MGLLHRFIIQCLFRLERVCLVTFAPPKRPDSFDENGRDGVLRVLDEETELPLTRGDNDEQLEQSSSSRQRRSSVLRDHVIPVGSACARYTLGTVVVLAVFGVSMIYYFYFHFWLFNKKQSEEEVQPLNLLVIVDLATNIAFVSFPFASPLHRVLGLCLSQEQQQQRASTTTDRRLQDLANDKGTIFVINLVCTSLIMYLVGEFFFFQKLVPNAIMKAAYASSILFNIGIFYIAVLYVILTMRVALTRLFDIEKSVHSVLAQASTSYRDAQPSPRYQTFEDDAAEQANPSPTPPPIRGDNISASTAPPEIVQQVLNWGEDYQSIRFDVVNMSEHFGPRMLLGLFLFVLDSTSVIAVAWEALEESLSVGEIFCMLISFVSNVLVITAAFYSMAFLVTECAHHIGPALSMLSVKYPGVPEVQSLATSFLLAPIRVHVGNFEVSPEYSNAIVLWFIGLFLLVFGLKAPGEA